MNDYVLVSGDFTVWGGMDHANYELAWYLAEHCNATVHLVSHFVMEPLATHPKVIWHKVSRPMNRHALAAPLLSRQGKKIARRLEQDGARVIVNGGNCQWAGINWVHAVHAAWENRNSHAPYFFRVRGSWQKYLARRSEHKALHQAPFVLTNSETARQQLIEKVGLPPEGVKSIYYGIDPVVFCPPTAQEKEAARLQLLWSSSRPVAIFIGALGYDRNKGFDLLFSAWERLCSDSRWDVDLVALGGGAEVKLWLSKAAQLGLSERIKIVGFTKNVSTILAAADLLVSPTHYEAYGLGVHEALCMGLPAFVTRSAGIAERYPADLAALLLNNPPNVDDLVQRLRCWRANSRDFSTCLTSFSKKLRQRTWDDMAREIIIYIEESITTKEPQASRQLAYL